MGRSMGAFFLAIASVFALTTQAQAHVVTASIFARVPSCHPACSDADSIRFRTSVRLDACVPAGGGPTCDVRIRAFVWAQVERDGAWTTIGDPRSTVRRLEAGKRMNIAIGIDCSSGQDVRYRTKSLARAIGGHTFYTNTPNPDYSRAVSISC